MAMMSDAARARRAARDWDKALDGVHAGNRALAARMIEALRKPVDPRALSAWWLRSAGYDVYPAEAPFLWEGQRGNRKVLVVAVVDDELAVPWAYLALRVSERAAAEALAGAAIVLLGWSVRVAGRCTVEKWLDAEDFRGFKSDG
jgi:hypothetical protein